MDTSVIIPVHNEEGNVKILYDELKSVLDRSKQDYEIIFIDDGSTDSTFNVLKELNKKDKHVKAIQFTKNFQKAAALTAGFREAKGNAIITMDGDRQDDPNEIPKLLEELKRCDLVVGWRRNRADGITKKLPSLVFNSLIRALTGLRLHDADCNMRAMKDYVVKGINIYGGLYRYIPILAHNNGYSVREIMINHRRRVHGKSKYGITRLFNGTLDLMTVKFLMSYTKRPMHLFGSLGFAASLLGSIFGLYLVAIKYLYGSSIANRPLLFLAVLLVVIGIQFFSIGLIGELITNHNNAGAHYLIKRKL